ncbi:CIC11C00000004441 [Sungouiella intermedia]|uniref:CIC11C00000004441 n=1 Tax=Sungouiella intermedia TaxID=45354 RepID=A0A1L0BVE7_9ASCO|nr:CIC11C00000004441 [[Candida] intermedia]
MKDFEKQVDYDDVLSRHTAEYNLSVSMSNPQLHAQVEEGQELKKALEARHLSMIAIGGALGTGLLIGTGSALRTAGPGAVFITYSLIGFVVFMVLSGLGEVATFIPLADGFAGYCTRYVDEALGFACGWVYLMKYLLIPANQLVAGSLVMSFWVSKDTVNPGVWIAVFLIIIIVINVLGVRFFGEIEFWLSCLKVLTCLGLIILLLVIALGGGPTKERLGFRYWRDPGAFKAYSEKRSSTYTLKVEGGLGRFVSFLSVLVTAIFAYMGSELVGITFAECARPRQAIPKAIKLTFYRILLFYICSVLFLGMCVSSGDQGLLGAKGSTANASPFVIAIKNAKIKGLDHVINGCILLFVLSAANSDLYICSRTIYGLAVGGYAPKIFAKTNRNGVPYYGILLGSLFCCLAFMTTSSSASDIFTYFVNVVSLTGLITWSCILFLHIRFMRALKVQGLDRKRDLAYRSPFQPFGSYVSFAICILLILIKNFTVFLGKEFPYKTFITGYIILPVFLLMFFGYKFTKKTRMIPSLQVDLNTYRDVVDAEEEKFRLQDEEDRAIREAQGNPKDFKWFYEKCFGWIF